MSDVAQTSVYLNEEDRRFVRELQERTGMKRSEVIRVAIHRMYHGDATDRRVRLLAIAEEIKEIA